MTEKLNHTEFDRKLVSRTGALQSANVEPAKPNQAIVGKSRWYLPGWGTARRVTLVVICFVLLLTIAIPTIGQLASERRYALNDISTNLLDKTNPNLSAKLTQDPQTRSYYFNKQGLDAAPKNSSASPDAKAGPDPAAALKQMQAQVGGGSDKDAKSLYSVEFPEDSSKGITYYDNNLGVSFKLYSQNSERSPRLVDGRIVYPANQGVKAVYTAKNNGIKEDIIVPEFQGDKLEYSYKLELPKELEARLTDDGGLGVYSADPTFFGNVSYGSPEDETNIRNARLNGEKKHLVFAIPAPTIVQTGSKGQGEAQAFFTLEDNKLTVTAEQLKDLTYPISVDPSVVITSSTDFKTGNNEGDIDFNTVGEVRRNLLSGATVGTWTATSGLVQSVGSHSSVVHNGYVYVIGGTTDGITRTNVVKFATISLTGTVGTWATTTSLPQIIGRHSSVVYNGNVYVIGGLGDTGSLSTVYYARLNVTTGAVGAWNSTTDLLTPRYEHSSVVYNNYIYSLGGTDSSNAVYNDVQFAPINASGALGIWQYTFNSTGTGTFSGGFTTARQNHSSIAYNGYVYLTGGISGGTIPNNDQYAPLNDNGTLGAWITTTTIPVSRESHSSVVSNGYIYVLGGIEGGGSLGTTYYAPIHADGSIGLYLSNSTLFTVRAQHTSVVSGNYIFVIGGDHRNDVFSAKINSAGALDLNSSTTAFPDVACGLDLSPGGRNGHETVAYNDFIYVIGGFNGCYLNDISVAPINSNGTLGTWSNAIPTLGSSFTSPRSAHTSVAYKGFLYVIGGSNGGTNFNDVQFAPINTDGTLGAWTTTSSFATARYAHSSVVHNNFLYVIGGQGSISQDDVQFAPINSNGTLGAWTATTSFTTARRYHTSVIANGYVYVIGGFNGTYFDTVQFAPINTNGTVGAWTATTSFPNARFLHSSVVHNGILYVIAGSNSTTYFNNSYAPINSNGTIGTWGDTESLVARDAHASVNYKGYMYTLGGSSSNNSYFRTTNYSRINNGGIGTTKSFASTTAFNNNRNGQTVLTANGYIYVLGGFDNASNYLNDVQYAPLNADGTVGAWTATTSFSTGRSNHAAVITNSYIYVLGGNTAAANLNDVQYAPLNADGTVGAWTATTSFVTTRVSHTATAHKGYIYILGGNNGGSSFSDVQFAPLNANGSVGAWTATTSFTDVRSNHTSLSVNNYLYVIGGNPPSGFTSNVQYAPINANGTIGVWIATTGLLDNRSDHATTTANGYVYVLGGTNGTQLATVEFAPINSNGTLGEWATSSSFATARVGPGAIAYNGYLYLAGGNGSAGRMSDVQFAPLQSIARFGRHSKLIDLGTTGQLSSISFTGTLPYKKDSLSFRFAGANGILSPNAKANTLTTGTCSGINARFVLVTIELDDESASYYTDSLNQASLQDLTVDYVTAGGASVLPSQRLKGGKYFKAQALQPLDTVKSLTASC